MASILPDLMSVYLQALDKTLKVIILSSIWLGVSIPLLFALFFFSTSRLRRQPMFIFNVVSICVGIAMGLLNMQTLVPPLVDPLRLVDRRGILAYTFLSTSVPIMVESILMFRLFAVFPYRQTPKRLFFSIFIPLGLLKAARVGNVIEFMVTFARITRSATTNEEMGALSLRHAGPKVEWFLQVIDNTTASVLFLWRLNLQNSLSPPSATQPNSYSARLRTLFWIAITNFIFPVLVSITLLVLYFREGDYLKILMCIISNAYIEIIGVLMATVWAASSHWQVENPSRSPFPVSQFEKVECTIYTSKTHWDPSTSLAVTRDIPASKPEDDNRGSLNSSDTV
ncbi:hypothetical protein BDN71DRAFT_1589374 [Pleurotus eryngii]|uniref:Uncharacterized protein n=1 Tax=Pleurotus eryngii TaxID=5323 RepID=A0A9P5ZXH4_PLEER|nr:hypothetical protein BDN71DRAFT_1589374 [Pleurotus eryngii]